MIKKEGSEYVLRSKTSGKVLGKFKTKKEAEERERQVVYFKNLRGSKKK